MVIYTSDNPIVSVVVIYQKQRCICLLVDKFIQFRSESASVEPHSGPTWLGYFGELKN